MSTEVVSILIPCFNEENSLESCVQAVLTAFQSVEGVGLEVIIVDDCSTDQSLAIAERIARQHPEVTVEKHSQNRGKGAALRTGFQRATGDYVAIQDADLEYDPNDLVRLLTPLRNGTADVVYGSRFLSVGVHRVLYFWHSMGNRFLTLLSNMFTDLNLTDMETCYKVFRREVIQGIELQEDRFGFEPEITAKLAQRRLRIYEMGVSYFGRTYAEGKKIGVRDGFRALYCIIKYNGHCAPLALQLAVYSVIGGIAALFNLAVFLAMVKVGVAVEVSAAVAFVLAAVLNYLLCIWLLFRHRVRWSTPGELSRYAAIVVVVGLIDVFITKQLVATEMQPALSKCIASIVGLILNFLGRRIFVFPERKLGDWASRDPDRRRDD